MTGRVERRDRLFDLAVTMPDGFVVEDIMAALSCSHPKANQAIHDLRRFLAESGDTINLPCDPQGQGERWLYRLVGSLAEIRPWAENRVRDTEARVRTQEAMLTSIVSATDGRSIAGRKARTMERALHRLVEDLDTIILDLEGDTP